MFEPKFVVGQVVTFLLTYQKAMILDVLQHYPDSVYGPPFDGYLVRLESLQEIPVREFELGGNI